MSTETSIAAETTSAATCPVNSFNEWDPLEEVIVGRLDGAVIPPGDVTVTYNVPKPVRRMVKLAGGFKYPRAMVKPAQKQLDEFIRVLEGEGVKVRRPDKIDHKAEIKTPTWSSGGFCVACPRDGFLVLGDEIIETPMAWRSRYLESFAYRRLFKEYFSQGARWTAAPKPELDDELFEQDYTVPTHDEPMRYVINEWEPVFDAADMIRAGKHVFFEYSNVTNRGGVEWLRRHLGDRYKLVEIKSRCLDPMHIDSSVTLLAPGKVLINPEYTDVNELPAELKSWDVIVAPKPDPTTDSDLMARLFTMCSPWISVNVLSLDEKRVIVEKSQVSMIRVLKEHGFEPIPVRFVNYTPFGGAFHCATLDIRRRGTLEDYFS